MNAADLDEFGADFEGLFNDVVGAADVDLVDLGVGLGFDVDDGGAMNDVDFGVFWYLENGRESVELGDIAGVNFAL